MLNKRKREHQVINRMYMVFLVMLVGLGLMVSLMILNTSSDDAPNFLPTAHFLEQHPLDTPNFIHVNDACLAQSQHCFRLQPQPLVGRSDGYVFSDMAQRLRSLTLTIDGQSVERNGFVISNEIYGDVPISNLSDGLHLVELSIVDKEGNVHDHAWTVRIGGASGAAIPTLALIPTHATPTP